MFEQFREELKKGVSNYFQKKYSDADLPYLRIEGAEGTEYEGFCLKTPEGKIAIPLQKFHSLVGKFCKETGFALGEAIEAAGKEAEENQIFVDFSVLKDWEQAKKRLSMELINRERNAELLRKNAYLPFLDLAIRFWVKIGTYQGKGIACLVTWEQMAEWDVTLEELYLEAGRNLLEKEAISICHIEYSIEGYLQEGQEPDETSCPLYVMTTKEKYLGAVAMLAKGLIHKFTVEKQVGRTYLIPSSVHEILLVPDWGCQAEALKEILQRVNDTMLEEDLLLSYHLYQYDIETEEITIWEEPDKEKQKTVPKKPEKK